MSMDKYVAALGTSPAKPRVSSRHSQERLDEAVKPKITDGTNAFDAVFEAQMYMKSPGFPEYVKGEDSAKLQTTYQNAIKALKAFEDVLAGVLTKE